MSRQFNASLDHLHDMLNYIRLQAIECGFDLSKAHAIELACEEALVNIIHYAYEGQKGEIGIQCQCLDRGLNIVIKDQGIAYNPLAKAHELPSNADEGGYGIFLMLELMDNVFYERENMANILTLSKYL